MRQETVSAAPPPFRRRRFEAPHRRRSLLALLWRPLVSALALVAIPAAAAAWMLAAEPFRLREFEVTGTQRVSEAWLGAALEPLRGRNLVRLPLAQVRARLAANPWVEGAEVRKLLPDRLLVRVAERRPAALLRRGGELLWVAADGRVIDHYRPGEGIADLPLIGAVAGVDADVPLALAVAGELARLDPDWAASLSEIEALAPGDFRLYLADLPFPLLVSAGRMEPALSELRRRLPEILRRYDALAAVDLRFARRIVIQPATRRGSQSNA